MRAGASEIRATMFAELVGELERRGGGTPRDIATRLGAGWSEDQVLAVLGELFCHRSRRVQPRCRVLVGRMTGTDPVRGAIDACRRAGLPVIDATQCTCGLRGRLVVLDSPEGLRVLWPYDGRCPVHGPRDREGLPPTRRPRQGRSRSQGAREAWAERKAGL